MRKNISRVLIGDQINEDEHSVLQLSQGSEIAFEDLYHKYSPGLYFKLLKILKSNDLAEDILQDVFIIVWNNHKKIDTNKSFRGYLYCIACHKCYDHFRKISSTNKLYSKLMQSMDRHVDDEKAIINKEESAVLFRAIELLPPKRKLIFRLCKIDGKSYEEVSQQLGVSLSTISDHIVKANNFIRSRFIYPIT